MPIKIEELIQIEGVKTQLAQSLDGVKSAFGEMSFALLTVIDAHNKLELRYDEQVQRGDAMAAQVAALAQRVLALEPLNADGRVDRPLRRDRVVGGTMTDDARITAEEFEAAGELDVELIEGELFIGGCSFGHGPAAHAFLRLCARPVSRPPRATDAERRRALAVLVRAAERPPSELRTRLEAIEQQLRALADEIRAGRAWRDARDNPNSS
jgi:hypothetical protein